jgi:NADH dehydrogenase FAD-containing subunit
VSTGQESSTSFTSTNTSISEVKRQTYQTTGGKSLEADLVFWATGTRLNNKPLLKNFVDVIDERGQIRVNKHLQVEGYEHIYAVGDITNFPEIKMAAATTHHADVTVNNILYQNGCYLLEEIMVLEMLVRG